MPVSPIAPQRYLRGTATAAFRLTWRGRAVTADVNAASVDGLRETLRELVEVAQSLAPVSADGSHGNPPGTLRDDIQYEEPHLTEKRIYGRWGNFNVRYSIFVNWGTKLQQASLYLERAMDAVGAKLPANIKRHLRGYR